MLRSLACLVFRIFPVLFVIEAPKHRLVDGPVVAARSKKNVNLLECISTYKMGGYSHKGNHTPARLHVVLSLQPESITDGDNQSYLADICELGRVLYMVVKQQRHF